MKSSRRDLLNDVAEHRSTLKNNGNIIPTTPVLVSHPQRVSLKRVFYFYYDQIAV